MRRVDHMLSSTSRPSPKRSPPLRRSQMRCGLWQAVCRSLPAKAAPWAKRAAWPPQRWHLPVRLMREAQGTVFAMAQG